MNTRKFSLVFCSFLVSCASAQKGQGPSRLAVEVDRIVSVAESLDSAAAEVTLMVENPSAQPIVVSRIDYTVDSGEVAGVLEGSATSSGRIESEQRAEVTFSHSIPFPTDVDAYRALLDQKSFPISVRGTLATEDGGSFSFERRGEIAMPSLPTFVVNDAQAARYGKEGVDVTIFLRLLNENVFPVLVSGCVYTVYVNDKKIKTEQAALGVRLLPGGGEEFEASTVVDAKTFKKDELQQILSRGRVQYRVEGRIELKRLSIPFDHTGEIQLATGE